MNAVSWKSTLFQRVKYNEYWEHKHVFFLVNHVLVERIYKEQQSRNASLRASLKHGLLPALLFEGIIIEAIALGCDEHLSWLKGIPDFVWKIIFL